MNLNLFSNTQVYDRQYPGQRVAGANAWSFVATFLMEDENGQPVSPEPKFLHSITRFVKLLSHAMLHSYVNAMQSTTIYIQMEHSSPQWQDKSLGWTALIGSHCVPSTHIAWSALLKRSVWWILKSVLTFLGGECTLTTRTRTLEP